MSIKWVHITKCRNSRRVLRRKSTVQTRGAAQHSPKLIRDATNLIVCQQVPNGELNVDVRAVHIWSYCIFRDTHIRSVDLVIDCNGLVRPTIRRIRRAMWLIVVIDARTVLYKVAYIRRSEAEKQHVVRIWGYLNGQTRGFMNADSRLSET